MAVCSICGSETVMKTGFSKKNGKPWTGFKCQNQACGNMDFLPSNQNISKPQIKKQTPTNEPEILKLLLDILRKQDEIKAMLEIRNQIFKGSKLEAVKPPEEAF